MYRTFTIKKYLLRKIKPIAFAGIAGLLSMGFILFTKEDPDSRFYMPAEWSPQEAVYVGWFDKPGRDTATAEIIRGLIDHVKIRVIYSNSLIPSKGNRLFHSFGIDTSKIDWIKDSVTYEWIRDPGPIFLINKKGQRKVADFNWNDYGYPYLYHYKTGKREATYGNIDVREAKRLGLDTLSSELVNEGGAFEVNGKGTMMAIEETAIQRNPHKSLKEIESEYLRMTGCRKIVWLKKSTLHDRNFDGPTIENWFTGGANGHIDEIARFVTPNTILLAQIGENERKNNPVSKADHEILEENFDILSRSTDQDGKPLKIIRVPSPDLSIGDYHSILQVNKTTRGYGLNMKNFNDGDTVKVTKAVSYLNFFISNNVVLVPRYWKEGMPLSEKEKDEIMIKTFSSLFPDRKIVSINPLRINPGGGGIHCATQQVPAVQ